MGTAGKTSEIQPHFQGMASQILKEVIRADMSMHQAQIEAWQWFSTHLPKGEYINDDLRDGLPRNMYLAMSDLSLTFYVKPVALDFWPRLRLGWKVLRGRVPGFVNHPNAYVICSPSDELAMQVKINVTRNKNGTVKATYGPADAVTAELLKTPRK
ncbi:hypothetical protein SAMN04488109_2644 [Chryseolinea serpens]|uniref:Uncharacterized protein n=2 Tax=Chryseolinea serpens TaxID=947013 RepID=A0A1M5P2J9_9BACT|nr:hypothetical protein SAMN04488109_2644 [Chryseolinea serpens]